MLKLPDWKPLFWVVQFKSNSNNDGFPYKNAFIIALLQTNLDLKRYFYSGMWHYKHKQASCGIEALISWESLWSLLRPLCGVLISPIIQYHDLTISIILSIWRFWVSISLPMSRAMWRRLPMMPPTCSKLSSISFSRASFVTLKTYKKQAGFIESTDWDGHNILRMMFTLKSTCIRNPFYFHNVTKYYEIKKLNFYLIIQNFRISELRKRNRIDRY